MRWLIDAFEEEFTRALEWYPPLDEAVLGALALRFPDKMLPIHTGHIEMFDLRSVACCFRLIRESITELNWTRAWDLLLELPSGEEAKQLMDRDDQAVRRKHIKFIAGKLYQITKDRFYKEQMTEE